jgi:hypothetical protein
MKTKLLILAILLLPNLCFAMVTPEIILTGGPAANGFYIAPNVVVVANHTLRENINGKYLDYIAIGTDIYDVKKEVAINEKEDFAVIKIHKGHENKKATVAKCSKAKATDGIHLNAFVVDDSGIPTADGHLTFVGPTNIYTSNVNLTGNMWIASIRATTGQSGASMVDDNGDLIGMMNVWLGTSNPKLAQMGGGVTCQDILDYVKQVK